MMKSKATILFAGAAIACMAILSGCSKGVFGYGGEAIRFSTTSGGSATKTEYGKDYGSKQALNWKDGDVITIASPQAKVQDGANAGSSSSNYVVKDASEGAPSTAKVDNEGTNGLVWTEGESITSYTFYSVYPKTRTTPDVLSLNPQNGLVTATIKAEQTLLDASNVGKTVGEGDDAISYTVYPPDMDYAFMTAVKTGAQPTDKTVPLEFNPAFTAVEFNVSSKDSDILLKNVGLYAETTGNDNLSGTFTMTAGNLSSASVTSGSKSVSMSLGDGVEITKSKGASFILFLVPKENSGTLTMKFTIDGVGTCSHALTYATAGTDIGAETTHEAGAPVKFIAGHKYRINMLKLPGNRWNFLLIGLTGEAIEWTDVQLEPENKDYPEATQFAVEGVNNGRYNTSASQTTVIEGRDAKAFRQYWLLDAEHPAIVKFKVMSPVGFDWLVVPEGDVDAYTITSEVDAEGYDEGGLRGPILTDLDAAMATTTNVILHISAKSTTDTAQHSLHLKTYVVSKDDSVKYSIDTETQLLDFRGYHYFILNNSDIVN
ncbi:MAG: fimbrillin family protein [Bacteroidales bacterium]|nr:fimbrillin family protein [Bacteroidales bacterium]